MAAARCHVHGTPLMGSVCQACDGQAQVADRSMAELLALKQEMEFGHRGQRARAFQTGGKGTIKFNPSEADVKAGIRGSVDLFAWSAHDGQPRAVTVDIGRISTGGGGSFPNVQNAAGTQLSYRGAQAQVLLGSPGAMADPFLLDIGRGQRFTASASYVAVTAQMVAPPAGFASGSLAVFGMIGEIVAPSLAPPVFTAFVDSLGVGLSSATIVIPSRANFLLPVRSSDLVNLLTLQWVDTAGNVIDQIQFSNGTMVYPAPCEDAYGIVVTNNGTITASYRLTFQLSI